MNGRLKSRNSSSFSTMAESNIVTSQPTSRQATPETGSSSALVVRAPKENGSHTPRDIELESRVGSEHFLSGLEALEGLQRIHLQQCIAKDIKSACGSGNTYRVLNDDDEVIFTAEEDDNCCCRFFCGPNRSFHVVVYNRTDDPVLHLDRSCCRCECCCCFDCFLCQHKVIVRDVRGRLIGSIKEKCHIFHPKLAIYDELRNMVQRITGPCCVMRCCTEINFDLRTADNKVNTGYIFKQHKRFDPDVNTSHENIEIRIPDEMTLYQRGSVLGSAFLVSLMYFEMS